MEGEDGYGPAISQLNLLQVDLPRPKKDERKNLTGKTVAGSEELEYDRNVSDDWLAPNRNDLLHIIVELPCGKRCVH